MKAWRRDAGAVKQHAIKTGKHLTGQRYGKALRDARTRVTRGDASPLFHALLDRFARAWMADILTRLKPAASEESA